MTRPNRRAKRQARAVADEFHEDGRDRAGERVQDALLSDELWCWLVEAAELAGDYNHERWQELDERDAPEDDLRAYLAAAEVQLDEALQERQDQLIEQTLEDVDE